MYRETLFLFLILILNHNCYGNICGENNCVNGQCENNFCVCQQCYTGTTCELIKNESPHFDKSSYDVSIKKISFDDNKILKVTAYDNDKCLTASCECGEIIYSILEENAKNKFEINSNTGEIIAKQGQIDPQIKYSFTVKASNRNPFDSIYDTATVFINADASDEILERHRRAVSPTKPTFSLTQIFPVQNLTTINIGQRLTMQLSVSFPVGTTTLSVELFAPETSTNPVMMLCDVAVHSVGSQLSPNTFSPSVMEGLNGTVWPYTHIVYNFTGVTHSQANPTNLADIQVIINFDVVMLYSPSTVNGSTYYVSGGSEYLNGTEIWVGQLGYIANMTTPAPNPNITITGDTQIYPGRTAAFSLNIQAPDAYFYLNLSVYTPLNNTVALSLCIVRRNYVGKAYSCLPTNYNQPSLNLVTINNQIYYTSAAMNLGVLGNRYYMEPSHVDINEKTINIAVSARVNPNIWIGTNYYVGFSITYTPSTIFTSTYSVLATTAPALTPYTSQISFSIGFYLGVQSISIAQPGRILLNITIPSGTELDYTITARSIGNTSEICGVAVLSAGLNIPCADQIDLNTQYTFTPDNYAVQAVTTIGGLRHVKISNDTNDDVLMLLVIYRAINDSRNTPGGSTNIGVALNWTGGIATEQTLSVTLTAVATSNANSTNLPVFTFQMKGNDGNVSLNGAYQLYFSMRLSPGAIYGPTSLEFYMPFNNTIRVGMCQININFVGKNVLCFNPTLMTKKFVYSSKINDTSNYDKLLIPTGVLCTSTDPSFAASINDEIQITINVQILTHSMNTAGATSNLNGGMMITSTQIWVGNQPLTFFTKPTTPPTLNATSSPLVFGQRVDALNYIVWPNDLAIIQYIIKVAPGVVTSSLALKISSTSIISNNFGVCQISIKNRGSSIPCVNGTLATTPWVTFSKFYQSATFTFSDILNSGSTTLISNPTFDDNSILVEAIVKFGPTMPASFTVDATLTSNGVTATKSLPFTYQSSLSRFNGTLSTTEPVFNMVLSPLFNNTLPVINNIAYSEAIRSVVSVQIQPGVLQSLKIIFASAPSTVNQMDVLSVNVLSVGLNIPCLQTGMIPFSVQQRSPSLTSDLTNIDMGTICHRQSSGNTTIEDNKIYIEAVFRVWKFPTGAPTTLQINVIGLLNNDQVYVTRIIFNTSTTTYVSDTNLLGQTPNATATANASTVAIGAIFTVNVTVKIPPYTQFKSGTIQILSPVEIGSDSSYFISGNLSFIGVFGKNLGINANEPLPMTLKSSMNTSQMDIMIADFGVVQNIGTPYRMGQANYSSPTVDDTLSVVISVRLTDNMIAYNGKVINFNVTTSFGAVQNIPLQITVSRTNNENINFNTTTTLLSNNTIYTSDTPIIVSAQAIMLNTSALECRNFTVYIAVPSYIRLSSIFNSSYSSTGFPIVQTNLSLGGFTFSVPYFFYKENISIVFTMSVLAGMNLTKGRTQSLITAPVIYACQTLNWTSNPMGNKYINKVDPLVFTVKASDLNITVSNCNDDLKLTDNTIIKDCAISAYMSPYTGYEALKIRSNSGSYWKPHMRGGQYSKLRYIDIKFGKLTTVSKIIVTSTATNKPQLISVYGTMDGRAYTAYQDLSLSYGGNTAAVTLSNPPFTFRGIRVSISTASQQDQDTGMNLDLFGCSPPNITDTNTFDPCTTSSYSVPTTPLPDYYYRGYLYVSTFIFVCDEIASRSTSLDTFPRCFRANQTSGFTTWEDLGNQVGKVVGFDSVNLVIYAIASDAKGYIMSEDNGVTWVGLNGGGWQVLKNLGGLLSPTVLPWTSDTTFDSVTTGASCTKYTAGSLNLCYDGIYSGTTRIFSWNNCCNL